MRHRLDRAPRFKPIGKYRPRHCSGVTPAGGGCFHQHADERRCACGQAIIERAGEPVTVKVEPIDSKKAPPAKAVRRATDGCHQVTPQTLAKAGA